MKTTVEKRSRWTFRRAYDVAQYGECCVVFDVRKVYPSRAHPGPAYAVWVYAITSNGTEIQRQLGVFSSEVKAFVCPACIAKSPCTGGGCSRSN